MRDGVSEGQYETVKKEEIKAIVDAVKAYNIAGNKMFPRELGIIAVVGGKRHHTRFFTTKEADEDKDGKNSNCKPGTMV